MTNRERCLALLQDGEWVTTATFLQGGCGSRFGARLMELRAEGYNIQSELVRPGSWRYRLLDADVDAGNGASAASLSSPSVDLSAEPIAIYGDFTREGYDPECPFRLVPVSELGRAA